MCSNLTYVTEHVLDSRSGAMSPYPMTARTHEPLSALRLYSPRRPVRFRHRLSASALTHHLLAVAKQANIVQAMAHQVGAG